MHRNMHALSLVPSDPFSTLSDVSSALVCVFCGALWRFVKARIGTCVRPGVAEPDCEPVEG